MAEKDPLIKAFTIMAPHYEAIVDRELNTFWGWGYESLLENMVAVTPTSENDLILDIATGTAAIPLKLVQGTRPQHRVIGLDITYAMLAEAKRLVNGDGSSIAFTCASAVRMPFRSGSFDVITCGLATHHMDVSQLIAEIRRVLKTRGALTLADVSVPSIVRNPLVRIFLRIATFLYFVGTNGFARARAEAAAIANVRTADEWRDLLLDQGFEDITVEQLPSKYSWISEPFILIARGPQTR